ncbi:MAG: mechanosensitive ion channel [Chitinophagaceae bacterium]|nr:mechanosensitive ion channel [Chitinophagaceae bacterium]
MEKFLEMVFLDNSLRSYLYVLLAIFLAVILKRLVSRYAAGLLFKIVKKVATGVDKVSFVNLVVAPLQTFLVILVTVVSLEKLKFPSVFNFSIYKVSFREVIDVISIGILIISFIWLLLRIIDFIAMILHQRASIASDQSDNQLVVFFKDFFKVIIVIFGFLLILKFALHYQIGTLFTGLSIATAAIALATRESLENLIASFIIFFDKPFTTGDLVKVQNITGTVEKIGLRSTRIRTDQKTFVTVPNKQMVDSIMDNLSLRTQRKATVMLELNGNTTRGAVNDLVQAIESFLNGCDKIESNSVFLADISKNALIVQVEFFTASIPAEDFNALRQDVNLNIIDLLSEMNIQLASKETEIVVAKEV